MENTTKTTNTYYHDKIGMAIYHLDPRWCRWGDFCKMADRGMTNAYRLDFNRGTTILGAERARETGEQIWLAAPTFFSCEESITDYIAGMNKFIDKLKEQELWDTVVGFQWDEPLLKAKHTNADLLEMTKAVYEEYGKRTFPVFSSYEVFGRKGNMEDPDGNTILAPESTKYLTDIGFDNYGMDFRAVNDRLAAKLKENSEKFGVELKNSEDYYRHHLKALLDKAQREDVKVWLFPTAYLCGSWSGGQTDEDYCIAHLEGMKKILLDQKNPGGLFLYTYKSWSYSSRGLDFYLSDENPNRWNRFEEAAKKVFDEIKDIKIG